MTTGRPSRPNCIDAETLAALVDGRLSATERAQVEAHLSTCDECREALVDVGAFARQIQPSGFPALTRAARAQSWRTGGIVGLAALITLVVGISLWMKARSGGNRWVELTELVATTGPTRPFAGRLVGGFPWAPAASAVRSGETDAAALPPDARIAIAHAEQALASRRSVATLSAYGAAEAIGGNLDESVRAFDECTALDPQSADWWSDLSAALLARSHHSGHAEDAARALEAADTALKNDPNLVEAQFNKALALEALQVKDQAAAAWRQYLTLDSTSPWSKEATQHLRELEKRQEAAFDAQSARERIFDEILPAWAEAVEHDPATATRSLESARALAQALETIQADRMAADVLSTVEGAGGVTKRELVAGHQRYGLARKDYRSGRYQVALTEFRGATDLLGRNGSPLSLLSRVYEASSLVQLGRVNEATSSLETLDRQLNDRTSLDSVRGRVAWLLGFSHLAAGNHASAEEAYKQALSAFSRSAEYGNESTVDGLIADHLDSLAEPGPAWTARLSALALSPRSGVYVNAARAARDAGWLEVATALLDHAVAMARVTNRPIELGDALRARSLVAARMDDYTSAARDLAEARAVFARASALTDRVQAELFAASAVGAAPTAPADGVKSATQAIAYFAANHMNARLPDLYLARARLLEPSDVDGARRDLLSGLASLDGQRQTISGAVARATFGDQIRRLSDRLVELELRQHRVAAALDAAERGRSSGVVGEGVADAHGLDTQVERALVGDATVIYFHVSDEDCQVWSIARHGISLADCGFSRQALAGAVAAFGSGVERTAVGRRLTDALLGHVLATVTTGAPLIVIPDGPLGLLPFGALPGDHEAYLIQEHPLLIAPSANWLLEASRHAAAFSDHPTTVIAFGNPDIDRDRFPDLPPLPEADGEAVAIAAMYRHGSVARHADVTASAFVDALKQPVVVHFAGHALVNANDPGRSLLPMAGAGQSDLAASDLEAIAGVRARLVVLASCQGSAGWLTESEGPLGLARSLLKAGVPTVVASQWTVDDRAVRALLAAFHQRYATSGDAVTALRDAQLSLLGSADPTLSDPAQWAGFAVIGGSAALIH
jgi:tetratricopeptide (TPR) repeat protein